MEIYLKYNNLEFFEHIFWAPPNQHTSLLNAWTTVLELVYFVGYWDIEHDTDIWLFAKSKTHYYKS